MVRSIEEHGDGRLEDAYMRQSRFVEDPRTTLPKRFNFSVALWTSFSASSRVYSPSWFALNMGLTTRSRNCRRVRLA